VLLFLVIGWFVTRLVALFSILFTGSCPRSLYPFGAPVMRWALRVEAYLVLLVDQYPPFALDRGRREHPVFGAGSFTASHVSHRVL
jgi:hypothetical protein